MRHLSVILAAAVGLLISASCVSGDDIPPPTLSGALPSHASPGDSVELSGSNFCQQVSNPNPDDPNLDCSPAGGQILFGSFATSASTWTDSTVMIEVPAVNPGDVDVTVTVGGRTTNSITFTVD